MNKKTTCSQDEKQLTPAVIDELSQKLIDVNKSIARELTNLEKLQEEMAFVTAKIQGKVDDRQDIVQSLTARVLASKKTQG